jgi:hypothetical protein
MGRLTNEHREKLLKLVRLANFLDDLPHDRFYMPHWASRDFTTTSCGTAGCAAGWAATIYNKDWVFNMIEGWPFLRNSCNTRTLLHPSIVDFADYFGITIGDAAYITSFLNNACVFLRHENNIRPDRLPYTKKYNLFVSEDITPRHAADRIREVVAEYDPELLLGKTTPAQGERPCSEPLSVPVRLTSTCPGSRTPASIRV